MTPVINRSHFRVLENAHYLKKDYVMYVLYHKQIKKQYE